MLYPLHLLVLHVAESVYSSSRGMVTIIIISNHTQFTCRTCCDEPFVYSSYEFNMIELGLLLPILSRQVEEEYDGTGVVKNVE